MRFTSPNDGIIIVIVLQRIKMKVTDYLEMIHLISTQDYVLFNIINENHKLAEIILNYISSLLEIKFTQRPSTIYWSVDK